MQSIDLIMVRENTESACLSEGQSLSEDGEAAFTSIRIIRKGSERIVRYAFELARQRGRKKVTVVHKTNIIKTSSGLFLDVARDQVTPDMGETGTTDIFADALIAHLHG